MLVKPMKLLLLFSICLLPVAGYCDGNNSWGKSEQKTRSPVEGMSTYYEPEALKKDDNTFSFKMYTSYDPTSSDAGVEYKINCETQEFTNKTANDWKQPERIFPGEQIYPFAKKICEWNSPGFFGRIKKEFSN